MKYIKIMFNFILWLFRLTKETETPDIRQMIEDLSEELTEQQIASQVGVEQPTINRWKTGARTRISHLHYKKVEKLWKRNLPKNRKQSCE